MSNQTYRLTALHQRVDHAIERELQQGRLQGGLRLLRLRKVRLSVKKRLRLLSKTGLAPA